MDEDDFADALRDDNMTALSRLGSSKALYADTAGEMDDEAVLGAAADRARGAAETFERWADDEPDDRARELFESVATAQRDLYDGIVDQRGGHDPGDPPAVVEHLRGVEGTVERVGALAGWALAASNNTDQLVGYFVGQADPGTAGTFRDASAEQQGHADDATATLAAVCGDEDDWAAALAAAEATVQADYDAYVETLESLGVNPKPVC